MGIVTPDDMPEGTAVRVIDAAGAEWQAIKRRMRMVRILLGDCRKILGELETASVHCCITSPPYFGLRDYGKADQIGMEATPDDFVTQLVEVFREVKRVLRDDGTLWLNLGDSYGEKKQLIGIPWRVAFALQADGWYLRQDIIWHKPNPMPESVIDRCTKAHEYIFLLTKNERYFFDSVAIKEVAATEGRPRIFGAKEQFGTKRNDVGRVFEDNGTRNKRSVWTVNVQPYSGSHFATFPPDLVAPCILAGCPEGGTVLDPFGGAGTTGLVAHWHNRNAILCELNPKYGELAKSRIKGDDPMFAEVEMVAANG